MNAITLNSENVTIADFTYDGKVKTPVLKYGETVLVKDKDYEFVTTEGDTASATNAGTYTIHVSGKGNYAGDNIALTWKINKAPFTLTGAELTYNRDAQNLISGDVPAGTKFTLTAPQEPDYETERVKTGQMSDALIEKGYSEGVSSDEHSYYCNAGDALGAYFNAITALSAGNKSEASDFMLNAQARVNSMEQYSITPSDEFKEAINYINTYIKGKTFDDLKARFVTVEPDDWSDTITATNAGDYTVYYKGSGNYDDTVKNVTASIAKAVPAVQIPTMTAKYGQTLADVELPTVENGIWAWNLPATTSVGDVGENKFSAGFLPNDTTNYEPLRDVKLTVNVTAIPAAPTAVGTLNATYGDTLDDVDLPTVEDGSGSWAWKDAGTTSVGNAGEQTFKAVFTPSSTNYTAVEQNVTINVAKADPIPEGVDVITVTYGSTLADIKLPKGWAWKNDTLSVGDVGLKRFGATYTPTDTNNYNVIEGGVQINVVAVDKTALNKAIAAADTYLATIKKTVYADPALALTDAIAAANAVSTNDNVTKEQVAQAITDVNNAVTTAEAAVKDIDDTKAAQAVTDKINALPAVENIKSTDKEAIKAARAAYNALVPPDQTGKVTEATLAKLTAAEKAVADHIAADAVIAKINAISEVVLTNQSKALIDAARTAYEALATDAQKALVSNYTTLTADEQKYSDLQVGDVKAKIDAIGDIELTDESKAAIDTARAAFKALNADQQALVANAKVLDYAEKLYDALEDKKTAETDKATAQKAAQAAAAAQAQAEADKATAETEAAKALDNAAKAAKAQAKAEEDAATAKTAQATAEKAAADAKTAQTKAEKEAAAAKTAQAKAEKATQDAADAQAQAEVDKATAETEAAKAAEAQAKAEAEAADAKKAQAKAEKAAQDAADAQAQAEADKATAETEAAKALDNAAKAAKAQATAEKNAETAKAAQAKAEEDAATAKTAQATAEKNAEAANSKVSDLTEQLAAAVKQIEELESSGNVDEALKKQVAELKEQLDAAKTAQNEANEALAKAQDVAAAKIAAAEAAQEKAEEEATAAEKAQATAEQTAKEATEKAAAAEKAQATAEQTAKEATEKAAAAEEAQKVAEAAQAEAEKKAAEEKAAADQNAAEKVIEKINAIGKVHKTNSSENAIIAARSAYDTLTDDQKALVTNYDVLTKAESDYDALPQTGMSGFHKVFAGLAALMGITGIGLIKKSRKEDDDE